jgi:hypothetical protein
VFQENLDKARFIPSPLRGRHRVGVIICSVISKCYHPPPNPLPSREGEFWGQEILKILPRHDTGLKVPRFPIS